MGVKTPRGAKKAGILTDEVAIKKNATPTEVPPSAVEEMEQAVTTAKAEKAKPFKALGELDEFGFGENTETSYLLGLLSTGEYTKDEMLKMFQEKFAGPESKDPGGFKRKKISFGVFLSDVRKQWGTYHASRGLIIVEGDGGKLSLDPDRTKLIKSAIKNGVLKELKGFTLKKHPEKVAAVIKKFKLPKVGE